MYSTIASYVVCQEKVEATCIYPENGHKLLRWSDNKLIS